MQDAGVQGIKTVKAESDPLDHFDSIIQLFEAYVLIHSVNSSDCTEKGKEPRMS